MPGGRTSLYYDLLDGFKMPGCVICRYALRAVERFFDTLTYENTNDPAVRQGLRSARGFCNRHTVQYLACGDELGAAIIYRDLLHTIIPAIAEATPEGLAAVAGALTDPDGGQLANRARRALAPDGVCVACQRLQESEEHYRSTLLHHLGTSHFATAYAQSAGLCVVHVEQCLQARPNASRRSLLVRVQQRCWQEALERLDERAPAAPVLEQALAAAVGARAIRP